MPDPDKKDETPAEDNSTEKKTPEEEKKDSPENGDDSAGEKPEEKTAEEKEAEKEKADKDAADDLEKDKAETAATKEHNQKLQSQVDKVRKGAEDKKQQLENQLGDTDDPAEKLVIERAIFDLEKGLFELDRDTAAGTSFASKVTAELSALGYDAESDVSKQIFAIIEKGGDSVEATIVSQLDLLKAIGPRTEEKKAEVKPADINAGKEKGDKPTGDNTLSVSASEFAQGGDSAKKAGEKLEALLDELGAKENK